MLKSIHMLTALISISLFITRGIWVARQSSLMQKKWVKIVPHVNDTILLVTAIMMSVAISQYPITHHWVTAKVIALLLYIGLGMMTLKYCKTRGCRLFSFAAAVLTFAYIVSVARVRDPAGFFYFL